jgi:hypothetical protein
MTDTRAQLTICEPWPSECWSPPADLDASVASDCWDAAVGTMWALMGRRIGVCPYSAWFGRVAYDNCLPFPLLWRGEWYNVYTWPLDCCRIKLAPSPLVSVDSVLIDGVELVEGTDYVVDGSWLVSLGMCWPIDFPCEARRMQVQWTAGVMPPGLVTTACAEIATALAKACAGDPTCALPLHTQSVSRLGVTIAVGEMWRLIHEGYTGFPLTDLAIRTFNPNRLPMASTVKSVDVVRPQWV